MTSRIARRLLWVVVPAILLVAATAESVRVDDAAGASLEAVGPGLPAAMPQQRPSAVQEQPAPTVAHVDPRGDPARVVIPAIGVDVDLVRLGLSADGTMELPEFGHAGWYTEGPKPGHAGPAAIVAHVDSRSGPDVFHRLGELSTGDEIHVVYDSGDAVTFIADRSEQTPKEELPVAAIWPLTTERLLTLITCGGEFDANVGHYRDNVIVYTSLSAGG